ncbi:MAG: adenosylcobinamide-GDP ribazoletransferase [Desulfonauticus sp.]|nr:adenosylcobinamide-GDP ribazoletransferase [Desulfonauticus sp.]
MNKKNILANFWQEFLFTLSFFSLLITAPKVSEHIFEHIWFYLFPVSLIIGTLAGLPLLLPLPPNIKTLISLGLLLICTRCFHWDGFADLLDAIGSNAQQEDFFRVLKDSRIGVFGCIGVCMGLFSQWALLAYSPFFKTMLGLVVFSRGQLPLTTFVLKKYAKKGLGQNFFQSISVNKIIFNQVFSLAFISFLFDPFLYLKALFFYFGILFYLYFLAQKHHGANGDFLGASIIWGEIMFLAALSFHLN